MLGIWDYMFRPLQQNYPPKTVARRTDFPPPRKTGARDRRANAACPSAQRSLDNIQAVKGGTLAKDYSLKAMPFAA